MFKQLGSYIATYAVVQPQGTIVGGELNPGWDAYMESKCPNYWARDHLKVHDCCVWMS